jgi:Fe2+ or Zn2+ uptake regulation protein
MKTVDGKKIILFCSECGRVKVWDNEGWQVMTAEQQAGLVKENHTKFVKSICSCCEKK